MFKILKKVDYILIAAVAAILLLSTMTLKSASSHLSGSYWEKQLLWIFLGTAIAIFLIMFDYKKLAGFRNVLYVYGTGLFLLVLVLIIGSEIKGAKAWIKIPGVGSLQPGELGKITFIVFFAYFLSRREQYLGKFSELFVSAAVLLPYLLLVLLQPDMGTGMVLCFIWLGMLFTAGYSRRIMAGVFGGGFLSVVLWIYGHVKFGWYLPLRDYQLDRILVVFNPDIDPRGAGWNIWQSKIAIGSGGFLGKGFGSGTQSSGQFLPEQWTDFIFSVLAEEGGFLYAFLLLFLYAVVIYRCLKIAYSADDMFGALIAAGVASMFFFHVTENIGMTMGVLPATGIPLPFMSYGGSSMLTNFMGLSLVQNVWIRRQKILF